jgi:hypothetical protein
VITSVVTDGTKLTAEPTFGLDQFYPPHPLSLNRFLSLDGTVQQRVVVVPGQFKGSGSGTTGTQRLYDDIQMQVFTADRANPDFFAPQITEVSATGTSTSLVFRARVGDDSGQIQRVVVLYAKYNATSWSIADLTYDPATGMAEAVVPPLEGNVVYFVQAVDGAGNVAISLDHNRYYVTNPVPVLGQLGTPSPVQLGAATPFPLGTFSDAADDGPWTVAVDWGDGTANTTFSRTTTGALGSQSHTYATVGIYQVTVTVTDKYGGSGRATFTVRVVFPFSGFFQPVDNPPVLNQVNAGRSIPVKFSLGGNRGLAILAPGSPTSTQFVCDASDPIDPVEQTTASNSGLTYDAATKTYTYNWKTNKAWAGTCRQFTLKLIDGTSRTADFKFVK